MKQFTLEDIKNGKVGINYTDKKNNTLLHSIESPETIKYLIEAGLNVNAKNKYNKIPLFMGNKNGLSIKYLIDAGTKFTVKELDKSKLLHNQSEAETVKCLIDAGIDINLKDSYNCSPLHYYKEALAVKYLIDAGADIHSLSNTGHTPLFEQTDAQSIKYLLDAGADQDVNILSYSGYNALYCQTDGLAVKYLIDAGIDVFTKYKNGLTALHYQKNEVAIKCIIDEYIKFDVNINVPNDCNLSPLHFEKDIMAVKYLLSAGLDVNIKNNNMKLPGYMNKYSLVFDNDDGILLGHDHTPLYFISDMDIILLLLENGAEYQNEESKYNKKIISTWKQINNCD
jgi:ankyrin repeat protein